MRATFCSPSPVSVVVFVPGELELVMEKRAVTGGGSAERVWFTSARD